MKSAAILSCLIGAALGITTVNNPSVSDFYANDNNVLAVAITAENFDTNYYRTYLRGAKAFTRQQFISAGFPDPIYTNFVTFLGDEEAHIAVLQATLKSRNGTTIPACTYKYPTTSSVNDFIFYSKVFENTGTAAYDGSINAIKNQTLQTAAATIATVEARHAAFLNSIPNVLVPAGFSLQMVEQYGINVTNGPFPVPFDLALPADQVFDLIGGFIASCPYKIPINPYPAVVIPIGAPTQVTLDANDVKTLNFALTLELLEATYYNRYYHKFSQAAFVAAGYPAIAHTYFGMVTAHENSHVAFLQSVLGSQAVVNCTYNFGTINTVSQFVTLAANLENTGVSAYDGSVNTISNPVTRQYAAVVATVEARHAAYINSLLNGTNFFPAPFDTPLTAAQVVAALKSAGILDVTTCPKVPVLPSVIPVVPSSNSTTSTQCNAKATVSPRPNGSWVSGTDHYQIYDITFVNSGKCAINTASLKYNSVAGFVQSFNYNNATGVIDVFSGVNSGATYSGAGYIVDLDKAPGFVAQTYAFSFTCSNVCKA